MIGSGLSDVVWESIMRRLLVAGFIGVAGHGAALAADPPDLPVLRGAFREPAPIYRTVWQGFYVGGQVGYGSSGMDLNEYAPDPQSNAVWPFMENVSHRAGMFGVFAGYNAQYENVVLGFEGNYMHGTFTGASFAERTTVALNIGPIAGLDHTAIYRSDGAVTVKDLGSFRVRGGYTMGNFMPYFFAGVALGRADTSRAMTLTGIYSGTTAANGVSGVPRVTTIANDTNNQLVHGFAGGAGIDWMLFGGLFARAEYEYLQFTNIANTSIHSVRAGIGYKF